MIALLILAPAALLAGVWLTAAGCLRREALREGPPREVDFREWDLLVGFGLFAAGMIGLSAILAARGLFAEAEIDTAMHIAMTALLSQLFLQMPVVLYTLERARRQPRGLAELGLAPGGVRTALLAATRGLCAALPLVLMINAIVSMTAAAMGHPAPTLGHRLLIAIQESESMMATAIIIGSAIVIAPLLEEIFFRGLIQTTLLNLLGRDHRWMAVLGTALIFTLMHANIAAWQTLPGLYVLAVILGWTYERYGSLPAVILLHMGFNATMIGLLFAGEMLTAPSSLW